MNKWTVVSYFVGVGVGLAVHDRVAAWWHRVIRKRLRVVSFRGLTRRSGGGGGIGPGAAA